MESRLTKAPPAGVQSSPPAATADPVAKFGRTGRDQTYAGRGRVLRIKEGYNPNSSSLGSVVFSIPAGLLAAPVILAGAAAWIAARFAVSRQPEAPAAPAETPVTDEGDA